MTTNGEILEFVCGIRAYPPAGARRYWRIRWEEAGRRRDTTAGTRTEAIAKASELLERLGRGTPTDLARATGAELVAHYLDPARRPARGNAWSERHRDEQTRYCKVHVLPEIATVACRRLTRVDIQRVLDRASTASVAQHLRRCVTGIVNAGLDQGHLLPRQDLLRGLRWRGGEHDQSPGPDPSAITVAEIPTASGVHALAAAAAAGRGQPVWWRELEIEQFGPGPRKTGS